MSLPEQIEADVVVVGAGPAGSTAAYYLASHGVDVALLEKSDFPREKVCGDGLTPRAVRQLTGMGIDTSGPGWMRNRGLRFISKGSAIEVDWPEGVWFPGYGLTRTRQDFDEILVRQAEAAGARLYTSTKVTTPLFDKTGRTTGVSAIAGPDKREVEVRGQLVIAADGASARVAIAAGIERIPKRPVGTAVRRYYYSPARHDDSFLEVWFNLDLPNGKPLPGYGWIFPLGDGRVNVGLGVLQGSGSGDTRTMLDNWMAGTSKEWELHPENADGPMRGAALPMGFSRLPHYRDGLLLVGDAGGMANPTNGEGISYAMESAELAADVVIHALARPHGPSRERALGQYANELNDRLGRYYRFARLFAAMLEKPAFSSLVIQQMFRSPWVMKFMIRLLSNLTDEPSVDVTDHVINTFVRTLPTGRTPG
jgi:menaquinone-9 beta-reductase